MIVGDFNILSVINRPSRENMRSEQYQTPTWLN